MADLEDELPAAAEHRLLELESGGDEQLELEQPPPVPIDYFQRQFPNALLVNGLKRITDNCLADTLKSMVTRFAGMNGKTCPNSCG